MGDLKNSLLDFNAAIELDERTFAKYGRKDYTIYIQNADGTMPWKEIIGMPVVIENDCKF